MSFGNYNYAVAQTYTNAIWRDGVTGGDITIDANGIDTTDISISTGTSWVNAGIGKFRKRRRFLGRKEGAKPEEAGVVFDLIKKGLTKQKEKRFKELAEKAFENALKYSEIGQKSVSKEFEEIFTKNLKLAAIQVAEYDLIITKKQVEKYRDKLPCQKELVVDDLEEYEKPIPRRVVKKLEAAKEWKVFDSFCVFWIQEVKDPILFGQIKEEPDKFFFIAEWARDISVKDLMKL